MKVSITTFERQLRGRLLDVVYAQWLELGVPFSLDAHYDSNEVIDPEALLWCSLEFIPTEPRLREGVLTWLSENRHYLIRQRVRRQAKAGDPRTNIWYVIDRPRRLIPATPHEPCHGLASEEDVLEFCRELEEVSSNDRVRRGWLGRPARNASTVLLRARDLLGGDLRHLLLVYLLGNPGGSLLRDVSAWSRYSYRNIAETVSRWASAEALKSDHGFCRLENPEDWKKLLRVEAEHLVIVDWFTVFDAAIRLLRVLAESRRKDLSLDGTVVASFRREAQKALSTVVRSETLEISPSIAYLSEAVRGLGAQG